MTTTWLFALALTAMPLGSGTQSVAIEQAQASQPDRVAAPRSAAKLRQAIRATLKRTAPSAHAEPQQAGRDLLSLYVELRDDSQMARADRERYLRVLRSRLQKVSRSISASVREQPRPYEDLDDPEAEHSGLGGAAVRDDGRQLVELIQQTIAPSSWDVNGGPGTVMYYPPLRVLVIRQTGETHGVIGDVLGGLRGR
jgi:hypothetical protein